VGGISPKIQEKDPIQNLRAGIENKGGERPFDGKSMILWNMKEKLAGNGLLDRLIGTEVL